MPKGSPKKGLGSKQDDQMKEEHPSVTEKQITTTKLSMPITMIHYEGDRTFDK